MKIIPAFMLAILFIPSLPSSVRSQAVTETDSKGGINVATPAPTKLLQGTAETEQLVEPVPQTMPPANNMQQAPTNQFAPLPNQQLYPNPQNQNAAGYPAGYGSQQPNSFQPNYNNQYNGNQNFQQGYGAQQGMPPTQYQQGFINQQQNNGYQQGFAQQNNLPGGYQQGQFGQPPNAMQGSAQFTQPGAPIQLSARVDARGTPVLPSWKSEPDEIIGHFGIEMFGIRIKSVDGPTSNRIEFHKYQKWRGNTHSPCFIWLTQITDGSGGYFFHCMESPFGPRGWIYPIPKRGSIDKVIPWAIFFDQP